VPRIDGIKVNTKIEDDNDFDWRQELNKIKIEEEKNNELEEKIENKENFDEEEYDIDDNGNVIFSQNLE
jgi:hypothetical protein